MPCWEWRSKIEHSRKIKVFFLIAFFSLTSQIILNCSDKRPINASSESFHIAYRCKIQDQNGTRLWSFKSEYCLYLDDGRFIGADRTGITLYNNDMTVAWHKKIPVHHQINWSIDKKKLLVLSDEVFERQGKKAVADKLVILNLDGKVLKQFQFSKNLEKVNELAGYDRMKELPEFDKGKEPYPGVKFEYTHSNSFYEIPENKYSENHPFMRKGHYIININDPFITVILDANLSTIIWSIAHLDIGNDRGIHDLKVMEDGKFLFFYNKTNTKRSAISTYDPITKKLENLYERTPPTSFYSQYKGSVDLLKSGNLFFSDGTNGVWAYEINPKNPKMVLWSVPINEPLPHRIQKKYLESFLRNNKGL